VRVGVNLLWLVPGEVGGSETWITELLAELEGRDHRPELVVFASPTVLAAHRFLRSFEVVEAPEGVGPSRVVRVAAEATWLAWAARRARLDILYHPGGTVPLLRATPSVVTIHDLQPLVFPENFSKVKLAYLRRRLGPSVRSARLVTAISEYTRTELRDHLGVPDERVAVTPPAVDPDPAPVGAMDVVSLYRLDRPWFVYPAITYRHKDHATVVRAMADVPDSLLVLTGGPGPAEQHVTELVAELGLADRIRRTGRIDFAQLDALYRGAVACVFPSRFEGVGIPVLEAMARSCPVIAADATALPFVVGSAGDLVPVGEPPAWAAAMVRLRHDDAHRAELVAAGRQRVQRWAPAASAQRLVDAWERAGAG
jgi:alpha-1,3-rhamnosyl/mannosyltransferase